MATTNHPEGIYGPLAAGDAERRAQVERVMALYQIRTAEIRGLMEQRPDLRDALALRIAMLSGVAMAIGMGGICPIMALDMLARPTTCDAMASLCQESIELAELMRQSVMRTMSLRFFGQLREGRYIGGLGVAGLPTSVMQEVMAGVIRQMTIDYSVLGASVPPIETLVRSLWIYVSNEIISTERAEQIFVESFADPSDLQACYDRLLAGIEAARAEYRAANPPPKGGGPDGGWPEDM